ncbi:MAG: biopolymer transport protein ExbD [Verrucomicrobiales bacterium]|jgi:biopolymer transport protein ExbD
MRYRSQKSPASASQSQMGTLSELNITPLLDLAFVLLIIFMITAPFLAESADLISPTSTASNDAVDPNKVQVISVDQNRELALGDESISLEDLEARLISLSESDPALAVVIKADKRLTVQDLVKVMDAAKKAGITRIGVVTKPNGGAEE